VNDIRNDRTSDGKIDKTIHEVVVEWDLQRETSWYEDECEVT
jgi:hypothetical protein